MLQSHTATKDFSATPLMEKHVVEASSEVVTIESRFGPVEIKEQGFVFFPSGLPGMEKANNFCVTELPEALQQKLANFKMLQSLDEVELSFVVLPIERDNDVIAPADIDEACDALGIAPENLLLFLITTLHKTSPTTGRLSVNTRAPLFIDVEQKLAAQHIFTKGDYHVRHMLG